MIELLIAFGAGLISFLSPCVLPLIPGYVSFISGQSLQEILKSKKIDIIPLILFCFGFSTVFIILGASASFLGQTLLQNSETLRVIAGVVIIIFSLQLIGLINISYLTFEKRFEAKKSKNILILGGSGRIGSEISKNLLLQGHQIYVIDKIKNKYFICFI